MSIRGVSGGSQGFCRPQCSRSWLRDTRQISVSKKCENMSHHLNSPIARADVRLDITDVYLFRGERGTVFVMNVGHSLAGQDVRGFHPEAMYEFKIDSDADAVEDLTYRVTFVDGDAVGRQRMQLRRISGVE